MDYSKPNLGNSASRNNQLPPATSSETSSSGFFEGKEIEPSNLAEQPPEIIANIAKFLSDRDKLSFGLTNKKIFNAIMSAQKEELGALDGEERNYKDLDTYLQHLERYGSHVTSLDLSNIKIADELIEEDQFDKIMELVQKKGWKLESLNVAGHFLTLNNAPAMPFLRSLYASPSTTDEGLGNILKGNQVLEVLDVGSAQVKLTNVDPLPSLLSLHLDLNKVVTDEDLNRILQGNEVIHTLDLQCTQLGLERIDARPSLVYLNLRANTQVTDAGLNRILRDNHHIQLLYLENTGVSLEGADPRPSLLLLDLRFNEAVTDLGLNTILENNAVIQVLNLGDTTNLTLEGANPLPFLLKFNLGGRRTAATETGINTILAGNRWIQILDMSNTQRRLELINPLPSLRHLILVESPSVTDAALNSILTGNDVIQTINYRGTQISEALVKEILSRRRNQR